MKEEILKKGACEQVMIFFTLSRILIGVNSQDNFTNFILVFFPNSCVGIAYMMSVL